MDMIVTFPGNKKTQAEYKGFKIMSDQAVINGGDGSAPAPFDLFLASLASCGAVYVIYFCQNRGIPTDNIRVIQRTERDEETHMVKKISLTVELPADFPEKYVKPLLKAVDKCTVKRHMIDPPEFEITSERTG